MESEKVKKKNPGDDVIKSVLGETYWCMQKCFNISYI